MNLNADRSAWWLTLSGLAVSKAFFRQELAIGLRFKKKN